MRQDRSRPDRTGRQIKPRRKGRAGMAVKGDLFAFHGKAPRSDGMRAGIGLPARRLSGVSGSGLRLIDRAQNGTKNDVEDQRHHRGHDPEGHAE